VDAVVVTDAHFEHSGGLPRWLAAGFQGPVSCTQGTGALAGLLLPDSAHLQEEAAHFANKVRYSRHHPALLAGAGDETARAPGDGRRAGSDC